MSGDCVIGGSVIGTGVVGGRDDAVTAAVVIDADMNDAHSLLGVTDVPENFQEGLCFSQRREDRCTQPGYTPPSSLLPS